TPSPGREQNERRRRHDRRTRTPPPAPRPAEPAASPSPSSSTPPAPPLRSANNPDSAMFALVRRFFSEPLLSPETSEAVQAAYLRPLHLSKLADHFHVVLASSLACVFLRAASGLLCPILCPRTYPRLTGPQKRNWDIRVVSMVHCLLIVWGALQVRENPKLKQDRVFGYDFVAGCVFLGVGGGLSNPITAASSSRRREPVLCPGTGLGICCAVEHLACCTRGANPFLRDKRNVYSVATGYFLWDAIVTLCRIKENGVGFFLHGAACFFVFIFAFVRFPAGSADPRRVCATRLTWSSRIFPDDTRNRFSCIVSSMTLLSSLAYRRHRSIKISTFLPDGAAFLMFELSTPFLNINWFMDKMGMAGSLLQLINGIVLLTAFFCARIVFGFVASWQTYENASKPVSVEATKPLVPTFLIVLYTVANLLLNGLNIYWFGMMIKALRKRFNSKSTKANITNEGLKKLDSKISVTLTEVDDEINKKQL
ncbi:MAG: TLC domain-containing protein, partial [Olpidium bornovanus]